MEKVKGDSNLQDKPKIAKSSEDVVSIAKEHGHEFTADKFSQLSEEELENVAGGCQYSTVSLVAFNAQCDGANAPGTS
nr:Nif11-like leader peptide family natural product precursor [Synechococcus sp. BIOS-E4-1]